MKHTTTNRKQNKILFYGKIICILFLTLFCVNKKVVSQVLTEDFSYSSGTTLLSNGWVASSGTGTNNLTVNTSGLSYPSSPASGVGFDATFTTSGEDASKTFAAISSGSIYASFLINISTVGTGDYCTGLITGTGASPAFATRVYIRTTAGGFNFGLAKGTQAAAYESNLRTTATTYLVVVKYIYNTVNTTDDIISLWVNPSLGGTEGAATLTTASGTTDAAAAGITGVFIRQGSAGSSPAGQIDGFRAGTTWASVTASASSTATLADITQPSGNITQGTNDVVLAGFTLSATASSDFTAVTISGTGSASDVNTLRVFRDNNSDGLINFSDASVSGAGVAFAASMPLTISGETGITTTRNYLIVANVDIAATPGNSVSTSIGSGAFTTNATTNTGSATGNSRLIISAATPTITLTGALTPFSATVGIPSVVQSYFVSGTNLTDSITIAPPAEFEISLDSLTWINYSSDTAIAQSGGTVASTKIFVRYNPASAGAHSGNITHVSPGAATQNQPVSGTSIAAEPTSPPTLSFGTTTDTSMVINFGSGNGGGRIVVVRKDLPVTYLPGDGAGSTGVNSNFNSAVDHGSGNKIVYDGSGNTVTLTNLLSFTEYHVSVFEYNGAGATSNYLITPLVYDSNTTTVSQPTNASTLTAGCFSPPDSMTLNFTGGNGQKRIVVAKQGSAVSFTPSDGSVYSGVNSNFGVAADQGSGDKILYDGNGTSVLVTGLSALTTFYFVVYEYNGAGAGTDYLTSSFGSVSVTTSSNISYSATASTYSQNFNTLQSTNTVTVTYTKAIGTTTGFRNLSDCPVNATGVPGWQYGKTSGTGTNLIFTVNNGASNSGSAFSYGGGTGIDSTDRALGTLSSGTTVPSIGLVLQNNTSDPLTSITVSYVGEQWRNGSSGIINQLVFSYSLNGTGLLNGTYTLDTSLNFNSPIISGTAGPLNGNLAVNQDTVSATIQLNGNWLPGQVLVLRWDDINDSGNDHGLAIDNFTFSANTTAGPLAQDSIFSFSAITTIAMAVDWLNGDGANHLVKINTSNSFTDPVNFNSYSANNVYSGSGEQVIYNGTGNSVNISGLTAGTMYYFRAYGYNGSGASSRYLTTTATENPDSQATNAPSAAKQLAILSVNGGTDPTVNQPFSVFIQSQDSLGSPQVVGTNTTVDLSLFSGIGNLSGNLSGIILAGTNSVTINGVLYDTPDFFVQLDAASSAGDTLTNGQSAPFNVLDTASSLSFGTVPGYGVVNTIVGTITVQAIRADLTTDVNYTDSITLSVNSGPGTISGTLKVKAVSGVATFSDIQFSAVGTYTLLASAPNLSGTISDTIVITLAPTMTELVIPKYIGCKTDANNNNNRTPIAMCIQIDNLVPGASYDIRMGVDSITSPATVYGAGNFWTGVAYTGFIITNAFTATAGGSSGPYWIYMQPATTRFDPGMEHNLRVSAVVNGTLFPLAPLFVGSKKITALDIIAAGRSTSTTDDGAFIKGSSVPCIGGKHVLVYDNVAGTGDPMYSYLARQSVPTNTPQSGLPAVISNVFAQTGSSVAGDYAAVVPTGANNPNGVQRIELRNEDNTIFNSATDADGIWPSGANTTTLLRDSVALITSSDAPFNSISITSISSTPINCLGNNGTATVAASGVGTITYSWNTAPVQTTATATGLGAGSYTVTVSDNNGCTATASVIVNSSAASTITPSGPTTFCAPGSVTLTAGTAVSYLWAPNGETTQFIVVSSSGNYSVTTDDGAGCIESSAPVTVTVNTFGHIGTLYSETNGVPSGTTLVNSYTGWQNTAPISYISNSPTQSDVRITGVSSGYAGASGGGNVFFGTAGGNNKNLVISGINTLGYSSASLTLSFGLLRAAGADSLTLEKSIDGVNWDTLGRFAAVTSSTVWGPLITLPSGTIPSTGNLRLRFSKNSTSQFRIDDLKITGTTTSVEVSPTGPLNLCAGSSVLLSSNIPVSNLWSPNGETTKTIVVTNGGSYTVTSAGANGCTSTSAPVIIQSVTTPSVAVTSTDLNCKGDSSGTATSGITDGTSPFSYSWNTTPVQTTPSISTLHAGTYILTVIDSNGCKGSDTTTIAEPATAVTVNATQDSPIICNGGSTTVTVTASGGTGIITGTGSFSANAGTNIYTVTDANGCLANDTVIISEPAPLVISSFSPATGCDGDTVLIQGTNLSGVTAVLFNGDSAGIVILSDTTIKAAVPVGVTSGVITVLNSDSCYGTSSSSFTYVPCGSNVTLNIKMMIEGFYTSNGHMNNFGLGGCLYLYGASPDTGDVDTVIVSAMNPVTKVLVDSAVGVLRTNGSVGVTFDASVIAGNSYYIKVNHRNTVEAWSAAPVVFAASTPSSPAYDFTTSQSQTFGNNMIDVGFNWGEPPIWAFYSGDIFDAGYGLGGITGQQDGIVESSDYSEMENAAFITLSGYVFADITGDLVTESTDYSIMENNAFFTIFVITP